MQANETTKVRKDFIRVDFNDPNEVLYLRRQFPQKTPEEIIFVIQKYGPLRNNIVEQLETITT